MTPPPDDAVRALGRVPSGLFIVAGPAFNKTAETLYALMNTLASAGVFGQGGNSKIDTAAYGGDQSFLQIAMNLYGTGINLTGANAASSASGGTYTKGSTQRKDKVIEPIWRFSFTIF